MSSPILLDLHPHTYLAQLYHSPACRVYTGISLSLTEHPDPSPAYARQRCQQLSAWKTSASFGHAMGKMEGMLGLTCRFGKRLPPLRSSPYVDIDMMSVPE